MIRVVVASDALAVRDAIIAVIRRESGFVLARAGDLARLSADADAESADVAIAQVADVDDFLGAFASSCALVVLTDSSSDGAATLLRSGARGVLPVDVADETLVAAVRAAAAGLVVVAPQAAASLTHARAETRWPHDGVDDSHLTPRERDVLRLLAAGSGNKAIARKLRISEHTVKFHVASILAKLNASSRTEAVTEGIRRGLVML